MRNATNVTATLCGLLGSLLLGGGASAQQAPEPVAPSEKPKEVESPAKPVAPAAAKARRIRGGAGATTADPHAKDSSRAALDDARAAVAAARQEATEAQARWLWWADEALGTDAADERGSRAVTGRLLRRARGGLIAEGIAEAHDVVKALDRAVESLGSSTVAVRVLSGPGGHSVVRIVDGEVVEGHGDSVGPGSKPANRLRSVPAEVRRALAEVRRATLAIRSEAGERPQADDEVVVELIHVDGTDDAFDVAVRGRGTAKAVRVGKGAEAHRNVFSWDADGSRTLRTAVIMGDPDAAGSRALSWTTIEREQDGAPGHAKGRRVLHERLFAADGAEGIHVSGDTAFGDTALGDTAFGDTVSGDVRLAGAMRFARATRAAKHLDVDQVSLRDGQWFRGDVLDVNQDRVRFQTKYGVLEFPRGELLRIEFAAPKRAYLGVTLKSADAGPKVASLLGDGPAGEAGIEVGDVIVDVDGTSVESLSGLQAALATLRPSAKVTVTVKRGDETKKIEVTLGSAP